MYRSRVAPSACLAAPQDEKSGGDAPTHSLSPPHSISQSELEESGEGTGEMSALQKALLMKKQSRVALKTKRVLAMMDEEAVIDDPNAKVKLLKHTKIEVRG